MKIENVYMYYKDGVLTAMATITVPGIGEVKITHALSTELCENISSEVIAALRIKLGQVLV